MFISEVLKHSAGVQQSLAFRLVYFGFFFQFCNHYFRFTGRSAFYHAFNKPERSRTILNILFENVHIVNHVAAGMVREARTVFRPHFINRAFIILKVKELAWLAGIDPVTGTVFLQPFLFKRVLRHVKMSRNALDIGIGKGRRHGLAAVGASQAICFRPYQLIGFYRQVIEPAGRLLLQFGKEPSEKRPVKEHLFLHLT
jgi:hypothetical protein